ncbi:MAG: hypothetical protein JO125_14165 [Chloroflexi bacterium]|nr:hypothetical protein [Chloroflexota bacterium]
MLAGSGTDELLAALREEAHVQHIPNPVRSVFDTFMQALDITMALAQPGDIVLFSPGFTSFGLFRNECERGEQFVAYANSRE